MARIRTVKPEFWSDSTMVDLSFAARLFYIGTWNFALCDSGHLPDDPRGLKMKIFPGDDVDGVALVEELVAAGRLVRIAAHGKPGLWVQRLADHQRIDTRWKTRCPFCTDAVRIVGPPEVESLTETHASLDVAHGDSTELHKPPCSKGKESKGTTPLPPAAVPAGGVAVATLPQTTDPRAALVAEIQVLRPDWQHWLIAKALDDPGLPDEPWPVVADAFRLLAADPATQQPGRLKYPGESWRKARDKHQPRCQAAGTRPRTAPPQPAPVAPEVVRAGYARAVANLKPFPGTDKPKLLDRHSAARERAAAERKTLKKEEAL